jgi:phospholipase/carboxylesterase
MSPAPESLVILLHGVGANGADLAPLGEALRKFLPESVFAAPDAPDAFEGGGFGRQWFSIVGINAINRAHRIEQARAGFDRVVAGEIEKAGFGGRLDRVALFGFSQGAIMALDAVTAGRWAVAAVVAASGRLALRPGPAPAAATPVLLLHGARDDVVPVEESIEAKRILESAGFAVAAEIFPALGHGVSLEGLEAAGAFLARSLALRVRGSGNDFDDPPR